MEKEQNLAELTKDISERLLNSINLLDILEEIIEPSPKIGTVVSLMQNDLKSAFNNLEERRRKIFILD